MVLSPKRTIDARISPREAIAGPLVHWKRSSVRSAWFISAAACAMVAGPVAAIELGVELIGIDGELEDNVRGYLSIVELAENPEDSDQSEDEAAAAEQMEISVRRAHARASAEIQAALQPFGYYDPNVQTSLESDAQTWVARYEIELGEPIRIDELTISVEGEGRDSDAVREVLSSLTLTSGNILRHPEYETAKSRLLDAAYRAGYIDARYERAEIRVEPTAHDADIELALDTGPLYLFGDIVIEQAILSPELVGQFVNIEEGEPFNPDRLVELQLALEDSGFFSNVTINVLREQSLDRRIPIVARTTPRPNQEFTVGAGYGTDTGPRIRLGMELRRLNPNGHRFNMDLRISARETKVAGEYRIPVRNFSTDYISYRAALGREEIGDFDSDQVLVGAAWNDVWHGLQRRFYLEAVRSDFSVADAPTVSEEVLYPGLRLSGRQTDDPLFTRQGYSWSADLRGGSESILSSTDFARIHLAGEYVYPLGERGRLLLRGELGAIQADQFELLIPSQRFFAGGDRSVRGYEFESLSPKDSSGAATGGRYLAVGSIEFEYLFIGNFGGAVFYDVGNADNDTDLKLMRGSGIGFRWRTPVGMLRIDLAHPLDDPETDYRLHLTIGTSL